MVFLKKGLNCFWRPPRLPFFKEPASGLIAAMTNGWVKCWLRIGNNASRMVSQDGSIIWKAARPDNRSEAVFCGMVPLDFRETPERIRQWCTPRPSLSGQAAGEPWGSRGDGDGPGPAGRPPSGRLHDGSPAPREKLAMVPGQDAGRSSGLLPVGPSGNSLNRTQGILDRGLVLQPVSKNLEWVGGRILAVF